MEPINDFDGFYVSVLLAPFLLFGILFLLYRFREKIKVHKIVRLVSWNLLLTFFLLSIIFLIGETYYRFYVDTTDSFALNKTSKRWGKRYYKYNRFGARDNMEYALRIASGKRRLTIIGDSFTAGHGIKNVDQRFGNIIRQNNPNLEVHIMAHNGLETIDELEMIQKLASDGYQFDIVLLAYCLNDISYLLPESQEIYKRIYDFDNNLGFFGRNSYFINTMLFRWFAINDPDFLNYSDFVKKGYSNKAWDQQQRALKNMADMVNQLGGKFAVVTFPFFQNRAKNYKFKKVHAQLNQFWKSIGVNHLDLLPHYKKYSDEELVVNAYDAHPNEKAHKIAARAVEQFLK